MTTSESPCFSTRYDRITRAWLETRFGQEDERGRYLAHEPVYGFGRGPTEGWHHRRSMRLHDLLEQILPLEPRSFLDVGAAEGHLAALVRALAGARVHTIDLSTRACERAGALFGVDAVAANAARLPFPDGAFEVVALSEVVEHLSDPVAAILEARRVASRYVVVSTEEWHEDEAVRAQVLAARRLENHMERNVFAAGDLDALFEGAPYVRHEQRFPTAAAEEREIADAADLARFARDASAFFAGGVIVVAAVDGGPAPSWHRFSEEEQSRVCAALFSGLALPEPKPVPPYDPVAAGVVCCPLCRSALDEALACRACDFRGRWVGARADLYAGVPVDALGIAAAELSLSKDAEEDLRRLGRSFELEPSGRLSWSAADLADEREPWRLLGVERATDGTLTVTSADPQMWSPWLGVELDAVHGVALRCLLLAGEGARVETFFQLAGDFGFTQEHAAAQFATRDELARGIVVRLPDALRAKSDHLVRLRMDLDGPAGEPLRLALQELRVVTRDDPRPATLTRRAAATS